MIRWTVQPPGAIVARGGMFARLRPTWFTGISLMVGMKATVPGWFCFFSSRRRHTRLQGDWSSDVCSSDLHGTFVAGELKFNPQQAEGVNVAVYAPPSAPNNAADFAADVARSVTVFSDMFGPLPKPEFSVIQIPDGTLRDFSGPGVLLLSKRIWDPKGADRTI